MKKKKNKSKNKLGLFKSYSNGETFDLAVRKKPN